MFLLHFPLDLNPSSSVLWLVLAPTFTLHFGHAYTTLPGNVGKEKRTHHALMTLGPSVLGSAFTTSSTAIVMLFAENLFIYKFGVMLIL